MYTIHIILEKKLYTGYYLVPYCNLKKKIGNPHSYTHTYIHILF